MENLFTSDDDDEGDWCGLSGDIIRYSGGLQPSSPYRGLSVGMQVVMMSMMKNAYIAMY